MKFDIVWEDCIQEEARVANRESLLREEDQALATHTKEWKQYIGEIIHPYYIV